MHSPQTLIELGYAVMRARRPQSGRPYATYLDETEKAVDLCEDLGLKLQDVRKILEKLDSCDTASHPMHVARCMAAAEPFGFVDGNHQKLLKITSHLYDTTPEACMEKAKGEVKL